MYHIPILGLAGLQVKRVDLSVTVYPWLQYAETVVMEKLVFSIVNFIIFNGFRYIVVTRFDILLHFL